jgi:hypothetical protein
VHYVVLEWLGEDLAIRSSEMVAAHLLNEPGAAAFGSSGAMPESLAVAYGMEDAVHA